MAMTASAMAYSWSRWNSDVKDKEKLVIQGCEQLADEPLLEVSIFCYRKCDIFVNRMFKAFVFLVC